MVEILDPYRVKCSQCDWSGLIKDARHNYGDPNYDEQKGGKCEICIITCPKCEAAVI